MAEYKLMVTDEEIDEAIARAALIADEPRVVEDGALYDRRLDLFVFQISDGRRLAIPREDIQGLENATPDQAAEIEMDRYGVHLRWPQIDVDHYLPNMLEGRYGSSAWMDRVHRRSSAAA
jgi:hypothetical protein